MFSFKYPNLEAKKRIKKLFTLYRQNNMGIPVDLEKLRSLFEIVISQGFDFRICITVRFEKMVPQGRLIPYREHDWIATVNMFDDPYRQRFSTCHEMAHILFVVFQDNFFCCKEYAGCLPLDIQIEEILCNQITMLLLCPPAEVGKFLRENARCEGKQAELTLLRKMSSVFEVPSITLLRYLKNLYNKQTIKEILNQFSQAT